jgi:RimJ/RimL family protein N-acetyltransferase
MGKMTELRTARLILRPARPDDAPCYALGIGDYEVARWLTAVPFPYSLTMAADWLRQLPSPRPGGAAFIIDLPGKGLIGCVTLTDTLGYWLARPHWGRGYMTEAVTALIDWHFGGSDATAITSGAHTRNAASLRIQARLGFAETGREYRYAHALQTNVEHVITSLTRAEWQARGDQQCA